MSAGQLVGGVGGAVAGFFMGGPMGAYKGMQVGMAIGGMLDPPKGPVMQGPRLQDLTVQTSTLGADIPRVYGSTVVMGNVIWLENNRLREVARSQSQGGKGGGGAPQQVTYTYYATFAVGLCRGEIGGVRRIWIGSRCVYDVSGFSTATPQTPPYIAQVAAALSASRRLTDTGGLAIYTGTETQLPDDRMQASLGINNAPAWRGLAYLVFKDLELTPYGNSLMGAQVKVEVMSKSAAEALYTTSSYSNANAQPSALLDVAWQSLAPTDAKIYQSGSSKTMSELLAGYWRTTRTLDSTSPTPPSVPAGSSVYTSVGHIYSADLRMRWPVTLKAVTSYAVDTFTGWMTNARWVGMDYTCTYIPGFSDCQTGMPSTVLQVYSFKSTEQEVRDDIIRQVQAYIYTVADADGNVFFTRCRRNSVGICDQVYNITNAPLHLDPDANFVWVSPTLEYQVTCQPGIYNVGPGASTWIDSGKPVSVVDQYRLWKDVAESYIVGNAEAGNWHPARILSAADAPGVMLGDIVATECIQSALIHAGDLDTSALTQMVRGYRVASRAAIRAALDQLAGAWPFDVVQDGYKIRFIPRGTGTGTLNAVNGEAYTIALPGSYQVNNFAHFRADLGVRYAVGGQPLIKVEYGTVLPGNYSCNASTGVYTFSTREIGRAVLIDYVWDTLTSGTAISNLTVATIPEDHLDARPGGQQPGIKLEEVREMDSQLPRRVSIKHFDPLRLYDIGEQYCERADTDAVSVRAMDLAITLLPTEAVQISERLLYMYWLERLDIKFALPGIYNRLQPADLVSVQTANGNYSLRLTDVNYLSDGRLECRARPFAAAAYNPSSVANHVTGTYNPPAIPAQSVAMLLDVPALSDMAGQAAGLTIGGYGGESWPGEALMISSDGGANWATLTSIAQAAAVGTAGAPLGGLTTEACWVFDKAGLLSVTLTTPGATLASVTRLQVFNGANLFAYGAHGRWEILSACNAVLQPDGSYQLYDLLRGQFGTEWATGLHQTGDTVILLDSSKVLFQTRPVGDIGLARTYKAVTIGELVSTGVDQNFTYTGENLRPPSPIKVKAGKDGASGDWVISWVRRARWGATMRDGVDAPLNEASEAYQVDILSAPGGTVKRTLSASTTAATYTSAQQLADFGAPAATLAVVVYQISTDVGRGHGATANF